MTINRILRVNPTKISEILCLSGNISYRYGAVSNSLSGFGYGRLTGSQIRRGPRNGYMPPWGGKFMASLLPRCLGQPRGLPWGPNCFSQDPRNDYLKEVHRYSRTQTGNHDCLAPPHTHTHTPPTHSHRGTEKKPDPLSSFSPSPPPPPPPPPTLSILFA